MAQKKALPAGQKTSPLIDAFTGKVGKVVSSIGSVVSNPSVSNYGNTLQAKAGYALSQLTPKAYADTSPKPASNDYINIDFSKFTPVNTGSSGGTYVPSTGGQSVGGGGDNGGGGPDYGSELRAAYDRSRSALEGLIPTYDADFNNYKTQVEGAINDARGTLDTQKADVTKRYGDTLKNLLNTSKDLRQRTQSTFSGLGSLDSSSYQDELLKQEQADKEGINDINLSQTKDVTELDNTFNTYERDQKAKVNSYQTEIDRAKAGVRQAMADGDIQQAMTLANYAQQIQANIDNMKLSLASSLASGQDVTGALRRINGADFNNAFGQLLGNRYNNAVSRYVIPSNGATGSGYINPKGTTEEQKRLLGLA